MERALRSKLVGGKFRGVTQDHSQRMGAIAGKGNKTTECRLRAGLTRAGLRGWVLHVRELPGTPDFAFPSQRVAVFVDGCFWHGCSKCQHSMKRNARYWAEKVKRNRARDRRTVTALRRQGYKVIRFWEHDLDDLNRCVESVLIAVEDYPEYLIAEGVSEPEKQAVARVRRAGVCAPTSAILCWVRAIGTDCIMSGPLWDIRAVARAF